MSMPGSGICIRDPVGVSTLDEVETWLFVVTGCCVDSVRLCVAADT